MSWVEGGYFAPLDEHLGGGAHRLCAAALLVRAATLVYHQRDNGSKTMTDTRTLDQIAGFRAWERVEGEGFGKLRLVLDEKS